MMQCKSSSVWIQYLNWLVGASQDSTVDCSDEELIDADAQRVCAFGFYQTNKPDTSLVRR